jgi:hypothetical protein
MSRSSVATVFLALQDNADTVGSAASTISSVLLYLARLLFQLCLLLLMFFNASLKGPNPNPYSLLPKP